MRLKRSRVKQFCHRAAVPKKDPEGSSYVEYAPAGTFRAEEWPGGGKLQAERYGQRLSNIRNLRIDGRYREISDSGKVCYQIKGGPMISADDGICFNVPGSQEPDYRIVAIYPYRFLTLEVEKL